MDNKLDARGQACPKPVIMTKKELEKMEKGILTTIVDNEVAKENVSKLASSMGYSFSVEELAHDEYHIHINKGEVEEGENLSHSKNLKDMTIAFSSDTMGNGDEGLGKILMKSFVYTVSESTPYPSAMIFYNGGVKLTCEGSEVLDDLIRLEEAGVEIVSCGTCLDYLNIKDKLKVGSISNMYTIYEKLRDPASNIIIG